MVSRRVGRGCGLVVALAVAVAVAGCGTDTRDRTSSAGSRGGDRPASFESSALWVVPRPGDCPQFMKVFDPGAGPPVADLDVQRATARSISHVTWASFRVRYTRPTALGLVVLVDGDLAAAKRRLAQRGVHLVGRYGDQDDVRGGVDPDYEAELIVHGALDPVVTEVSHRVHGLTGAGDIAPWLDAGAVLVLWKRPIPPAVEQLTRLPLGSRVRVVVEGAAYSRADLERAQSKLVRVVGPDGPLRTAGACGDDSGLVVGVDTTAFADRAQALRRRYAAIAGVPVTVVARGAGGAAD